MAQDICYKRSFLKQVLCRIDFASPLMSLNQRLPPTVTNEAKASFPIPEPRKIIGRAFQISKTSAKTKAIQGTHWLFHGLEREKTLTITPEAMYVSLAKYNSFEIMISEFTAVFNALHEAHKEIQPSRIGLRYINEIEIEEAQVFNWTAYLNPLMSTLPKLAPEHSKVTRFFHNLELNFSDISLKYQFGMHNPDYPAPIKRKVFILDLDGYKQGPIDSGDIIETFNSAHMHIQELFEDSITDKLREIMNG